MLEKMQPFKGGGDMIRSVTFEKTTYNSIPYKFEAGTPPIAAAIGLGAAVDYISNIGMEEIAAYELDLLNYATKMMSSMPKVHIIGPSKNKASVISFTVDGVHPHDIGTLLNNYGVAVRAGHHCVQPLMQRFKVPATSRASFAFYNTMAEVDSLILGIRKVQEACMPGLIRSTAQCRPIKFYLHGLSKMVVRNQHKNWNWLFFWPNSSQPLTSHQLKTQGT